MDTRTQGEQEVSINQHSEGVALTANEIPAAAQRTDEQKKDHHSSALYAASRWHGTVKHVKQSHAHTGLNL